MTHITCPDCGSNEHVTGYGFAAGPLGAYTICECGKVLEFRRDMEGLETADNATGKIDDDSA